MFTITTWVIIIAFYFISAILYNLALRWLYDKVRVIEKILDDDFWRGWVLSFGTFVWPIGIAVGIAVLSLLSPLYISKFIAKLLKLGDTDL